MLQWLGSFTPLFIFAGVMHPLAWIAIRALVGRNIAQIDLDKGLRTAQSPALLAMGLGLVAVGATLAALVFANWSYILSVTKNSAVAGGAAAASLLALMGLALVYASREVQRRPLNGRAVSGHSLQHADDVPSQVVLDFSMTWNRLRDTRGRVAVPVVLAAMAYQNAAHPLDRLDQVRSLHETLSSPTLRIPGITPLVRS